jgi:hypothetical protein
VDVAGLGLSDALRTADWMDRRRRLLNGDFSAANPSPRATGLLPMKASPEPPPPRQSKSSYFGYQGEADEADMRELRRRQAEAHEREKEIDGQNRWMLAPIIAPLAFVAGSEIAGSIAAREMARRIAAARGVPRRAFEAVRGENPYAAAGRKAHRELQAKVEAKQGWAAEQKVDTGDGKYIRPDAQTPPRNPAKPEERYYIDRKPNTVSGRRSGEQKKREYKNKTDNKTRIIFYDPKDYM